MFTLCTPCSDTADKHTNTEIIHPPEIIQVNFSITLADITGHNKISWNQTNEVNFLKLYPLNAVHRLPNIIFRFLFDIVPLLCSISLP